MTVTYQEDWEIKRSELTHNWLSNNYLPQLKDLESYIQKNNTYPNGWKYIEDINRLFLELLPRWKVKKQDLIELINTIQIDLSPLKKFDFNPLKKIKGDDKNWIKTIIHQLWLSRKNIHSVTESLLTLCQTIDNVFNELKTEYHTIDVINNKIPKNISLKLNNYISLCCELQIKLSELVLLEKYI